MTTTQETHFFDLHITGFGYLNRIREVSIRKGDPFLACDIVALHGEAAAPEKTRFDCKVSGKEAEKLIRRCMEAVAAKKKVLVGFRLGDLTPDLFTYTTGEKQGQTGVSLKARLLFVNWIKVDGELVHKAAPKGDAQQPAAEPQLHAQPSPEPEELKAASF